MGKSTGDLFSYQTRVRNSLLALEVQNLSLRNLRRCLPSQSQELGLSKKSKQVLQNGSEKREKAKLKKEEKLREAEMDP
jgi:hypothetical protein